MAIAIPAILVLPPLSRALTYDPGGGVAVASLDAADLPGSNGDGEGGHGHGEAAVAEVVAGAAP